jgi:ADP-L-glycero-D-manno-heptose 6-epimerase
MKRILITGATGFLGKEILSKLKNQSCKCLCISRKKNKNYKNVQWIRSDIANLNKNNNRILNKIIKFKPNILIFLSWDKIPNLNYKNSYNNLNKSLIFFNSISPIKSIKKIIVSGSCLEYKKNGICKETDSNNISDFFSWSKNSLLNFLKVFCLKKNISLTWFRIFFIYGKNQKKRSLIPYIIESLKNNKKPNLKYINNKNDFIHMTDVVNAFIIAINKKTSGIYNLGSGKPTSVKSIYLLISKILKKNIYKYKSNSNSNIFWASTKKVHNELKWKTKITLFEGLKKTIF